MNINYKLNYQRVKLNKLNLSKYTLEDYKTSEKRLLQEYYEEDKPINESLEESIKHPRIFKRLLDENTNEIIKIIDGELVRIPLKK